MVRESEGRAFEHSSTLFTTDDGEPMVFYMRPCDARMKVKPIIEHGGGTITNDFNKDSCMKLSVSSEIRQYDGYVNVTYIEDCAKENTLLPVEPYRLKKQARSPASTSSTPNTVISRGIARFKYTEDEDDAILRYMAKHRYDQSSGNTMYRKMEMLKITDHSWQSMRDRYLKKLKPKLGVYIEMLKTTENGTAKKSENGTANPSENQPNLTDKAGPDTSVEIEEFDSSGDDAVETDCTSDLSSFDAQLIHVANSEQQQSDGTDHSEGEVTFKSPPSRNLRSGTIGSFGVGKGPSKRIALAEGRKGVTGERNPKAAEEVGESRVTTRNTARQSSRPKGVVEEDASPAEGTTVPSPERSSLKPRRLTRQSEAKRLVDEETQPESMDSAGDREPSSKVTSGREMAQELEEGSPGGGSTSVGETRIEQWMKRHAEEDEKFYKMILREFGDVSETDSSDEDGRIRLTEAERKMFRGGCSEDEEEDQETVSGRQTRSQEASGDESDPVSRRHTRSHEDEDEEDDRFVSRRLTRSQKSREDSEDESDAVSEGQNTRRRQRRKVLSNQDQASCKRGELKRQHVDDSSTDIADLTENDQPPEAKRPKGNQDSKDKATTVLILPTRSPRLRKFIMEDVDKVFMASQSQGNDMLSSIELEMENRSERIQAEMQAMMDDFGLSLDAAFMTMYMCSGNISAARHYITHGTLPLGWPVWSKEDDETLHSSNPEDIRRLTDKYGCEELSRRIDFLHSISSEETSNSSG